MKKKHRLINIIYNNDRIYTRPERVMVVLVYLLYTMVSGPYYYKIGILLLLWNISNLTACRL